MAAFSDRLKDAVDLDAVRTDLASVIHQALEPAHVSVWLRAVRGDRRGRLGGWRLASPVGRAGPGRRRRSSLMAAEPPARQPGPPEPAGQWRLAPLPYSVIFGVLGFVVAWRKPGNPLGWLILAGRRLLRAERGRQLLRGGRLPAASREPATRLASTDHPARLGAWHCLFRPDRPAVSRRPAAVTALAVGAVAVSRAGPALDRRGPGFHGSGDCGPPHWRRCRREPPGPCTSDRRRRLVGSGPGPLLPDAGRQRARLAGRPGDELPAGRRGSAASSSSGCWPERPVAWPACSLSLMDSTPGGWGVVIQVLGGAGAIAFPVCIGIGILKYRLFDIDRILIRARSPTRLLTGLLLGVYAGLVLLATQVLGFASTWAVAASTLAAAALFTPLRRRVQRAVDRRFNRARYDADRMVDAFAARLQDAVDLDMVRADLATVVCGALEPAQVSVWIRGRRPMTGPGARDAGSGWPRRRMALALAGVVAGAGGGRRSRSAAWHHSAVSSGGGSLVLAPVFGVLGFVVAWRKPGNPLGWLLLGAVGLPGPQRRSRSLRRGRLPAASPRAAAGLGGRSAAARLGSGHRPVRAHRPAVSRTAGCPAGAGAGRCGRTWPSPPCGSRGPSSSPPGPSPGTTSRWTPAGTCWPSTIPTGWAAWWGTVQGLFFPLLGACWLASWPARC